MEYQQKCTAIFKEVLGIKHPDLAISYTNTGRIYKSMGDHQKALEFYQRALTIQEEVLDPKHPRLATTYHGIGNTYRAVGDPTKAMEYLQRALYIRKETLPPEHPDLAGSYNSLGHCHYAMGHYTKAIAHYQQAVSIDPKLKEKAYYNDLGLAYAKNGQLEEARIAFEEYERLFPEKGEAYRNWALYYALLDNQEETLAHLQKAVALGYKDLEWLEQEEAFNSIRESEQYQTLVKKIENAQALETKAQD